jgi:hypothetical protein
LDDAHTATAFDVMAARERLNYLRFLLGEEDYAAGRMPTVVPPGWKDDRVTMPNVEDDD